MSWSEENAPRMLSQSFLLGLRSQFIVQTPGNKRGLGSKECHLFLAVFISSYLMRPCKGSVAQGVWQNFAEGRGSPSNLRSTDGIFDPVRVSWSIPTFFFFAKQNDAVIFWFEDLLFDPNPVQAKQLVTVAGKSWEISHSVTQTAASSSAPLNVKTFAASHSSTSCELLSWKV